MTKGKIFSKNRAKSGFTIVELLVVVAIMGIILSAVSVGVSAAMHQYRGAMRRSQTDILFSTLYEAICAELRSGTVMTVEDGVLTGYHSKMLNVSGNITDHLESDGVTVEGTEGMIYVGTKPLLSKNAYQDGVKAYISPIKYNETTGVFDVKLDLKIEVEGDDDDYVKTHNFSVYPMNKR